MLTILTALLEEAHELYHRMSGRSIELWGGGEISRGYLDNHPITVAHCGVGKVLSAMMTQQLINTGSTAIIFSGLGGALNKDFNRGDIIIGESLIQHDMDARGLGFKRGEIPYSNIYSLAPDPALLKRLEACNGDEYKLKRGRILTGDQFVDGTQAAYLTSELQGDVVDMEGASVACVCHLNNIPWIVIRTISDGANHDSKEDFATFLPQASKRSAALLMRFLTLGNH